MKCPCCGAAELIHDTRDMPYIYKGESTTIPAVTGDFCPACGEVVLTREHGNRYSELIGLFQRQVNAAYVNPEYIAKVRRKLDLDQRQAAELFGGGVNAFSRYENGKTKPPLALVQLLKILNRHPNLLSEMKEPEPAMVAAKPAPLKARKVAAKAKTTARKKVLREVATA